MFLFSLILFQFFFEKGIEVSPSYINWESWNGGKISGGFSGKITSLPSSITYGLLVSTYKSSKDNNSISFNAINLNGGIGVHYKTPFPKSIFINCGGCLEIPWAWKYNNYNLTGISYYWGYYGKILYEVFKNKNLIVNTGLSYHNYPAFKNFTELSLTLETTWSSDSMDFHPSSLAGCKWVILEPIGGTLIGGLAGIIGGVTSLLIGSPNIGSEDYDIMGYYFITGWNIGIGAGIPLGVWGTGKYVEKEKGSFKYALLGTIASEIIALKLLDKTHNGFCYTIPLVGGIAGYRFDLYKKGKNKK